MSRILTTPIAIFARGVLAVLAILSYGFSSGATEATEDVPEAGRISVSIPRGPAPFTMYRYSVAANGICLAPTEEAPAVTLKRNGIKVDGAPSKNEKTALAKGIAQIEKLLGRPLPEKWRTTYKFISTQGKAKWNQGASSINVRRPKNSEGGANIARLMHELGHRVGNAGEYERYQRFTNHKGCAITGYAKTKSNEQFAEVFSAFVTFPDLLLAKCPKSHAFFAEKLFTGSQTKVASCKVPDKTLDAKSGKKNQDDGSTTRRVAGKDSAAKTVH